MARTAHARSTHIYRLYACVRYFVCRLGLSGQQSSGMSCLVSNSLIGPPGWQKAFAMAPRCSLYTDRQQLDSRFPFVGSTVGFLPYKIFFSYYFAFLLLIFCWAFFAVCHQRTVVFIDLSINYSGKRKEK